MAIWLEISSFAVSAATSWVEGYDQSGWRCAWGWGVVINGDGSCDGKLRVTQTFGYWGSTKLIMWIILFFEFAIWWIWQELRKLDFAAAGGSAKQVRARTD